MIGMDFISFLILLGISVVVSAVLHYGFKYHTSPDIWSFFSKIVVGWVGGWLGSPVFGHWFPGVQYHDVYFIPAILGSFVLIIIVIDGARMMRE